MKKRPSILYPLLFGLLMLFLFSFMIQEHLKPFQTQPLMGFFMEPDKPKFRWEWYKNGYFQQKVEKYIANKYGFREPIIRLYHQYCWDLYGKEYVSYIYSGKDRWLYYDHNIKDYYGTEMYEWFPDVEAARQGYEQEVRLMNKVRDILADYDVTLMTFIAPSKSIVYPEYLPRREHDTTTLNARTYYMKRFGETGMPCFDMNDYFLQMKDTCSFFLFPPTGDHWNFSCVYAADSLLRFMETLRDEKLPRIEYGDEYLDSCRIGEDKNRDLEGELNLIRPIRFDPKFAYKERDYHLVSDSTTVHPSALFIGNSFLLRTMSYLPPQQIFSDFQFWYYNRVSYRDAIQVIDSVSFLNRLDVILDADYIVWFSSASQMYRATEGFAEDAIIQLCIGEERFNQRKKQLIDSLFHDEATRNSIAWNASDSLYLTKLETYVEQQMRKNPETCFPEIAGEGTPIARNPLLLDEHYLKKRALRRDIKRDPQWLLAVSNTTTQENITLEQAIDREAERVLQGIPSLRDKTVSAAEYREILIKEMIQRIMYEPEWLQALEKEAAQKGVPLEEWIRRNATYMVDQDIYSGKIILPKQ